MKKYWILLVIVCVAAFLRLYKLDQNPPSLYWDEVSLGYNAFAILTTGHDEHGERLPLTRFIAFGDYKPPGYIYAIVPAFAVFGVNEFAVRFPSAIAGVLMVATTFFLTRNLFKNDGIALVAAGLLTLSPWSLHLSRGAFEAHLAALFNLCGVLFFLMGLKQARWLLVSIIFFVASFYTFNANRVIMPLLVMFLLLVHVKNLSKKWIGVCTALFIGGLLLLPMVTYLQTPESKVRFQEVTIFTQLDVIEKSNERIQRNDNVLSRLLHNRRLYYVKEFVRHYVDHFKTNYLFISGDANPRLSTGQVGEMYLFEFPFLVLGFVVLVTSKLRHRALLMFGWIFISIVPAATARETPHMLRTASLLPTYQILTALGFYSFYVWLKPKKQWLKLGTWCAGSLVALGMLFYFFHHYWVHYPKEWSGAWQWGYKEMLAEIKKYEHDYDRVYITNKLGRAYVYFLFYNRVSPLTYIEKRAAAPDQFGLWNVYSFDKYVFTDSLPPGLGEQRVLVAGDPENFKNMKKVVSEIVDSQGKTIFRIGEP